MRNSNFIIAAALLALTVAAPSFATGVPNGAKIFIAPMDNGLDGFLAPEIIKKKVPIVIASLKADDKWYHTLFGGKDKNEGNVRLLDVKSKQLVWAAEAGDRSLWWGNLKRGGQRKVADRIVGKMKGDLFKK